MGSDFINDSRQEEKVNIEKFDRHESQPYYLAENGVNFYIIPFMEETYYESDWVFETSLEALRPEIGSYWLLQYYPCNEGNVTCQEGPLGH